MEIQLKELLQHDSPETRLLGCKLAYGNGYKMHQIFREIESFELNKKINTFSSSIELGGTMFFNVQLMKRVGDYIIIIGTLSSPYNHLALRIYHNASTIIYSKKLHIQYIKQSSQRRALNKLKRSFMELVLK